ncbi:DUF2569 family protein [Basilea psittacipulmonis]|uniref:Uncharacterized protein n=1 Tax=Basilea psittacipulmonis DSM 24701 TaxID=1072685 RepID=A0A077DJ58_9BURK|nr:DUF2569 family protein [Basilea psittacipulmonis]AIL33163.1 hypothetical protein IX83_07525 [Basilea psittacipulmonis DSM 24701]
MRILLWVCILGGIGYLLWLQNRRLVREKGVCGVHGYLLVFTGLMFVESLYLLFSIYEIINIYTFFYPEVSHTFGFEAYANTVVNIGIIALVIHIGAIGVIIWLRRPSAVKLLYWMIWIAGPVASISVYLSGNHTLIVPEQIETIQWQMLSISLSFAIAFTLYLSYSQRVKNTYRMC